MLKLWRSRRGRSERYEPWTKDKPGLVSYDMAGETRHVGSTWYRGEHCNFHPFKASYSEPRGIERHVGLGWFPPAPLLTRQNQITTFGSCFASHVRKFLSAHGYNVGDLKAPPYVIRCGEGMVNTAAIMQQFLWAYGEVNFSEILWHDKDGSEARYTEPMRAQTKSIFDSSDVFIITLGLSEVWKNKVTGEVFWRAIPEDQYDPSLHSFTILDVTENKANLAEAYRIIRAHRPHAVIIFTLSPVPLAATFRPISCLTANSVSKAILRVAIDEFMRERVNDSRLFYFPSFELVKDVFPDPYLEDLRHIKPEIVSRIMAVFASAYLRDFY